MPSPTIDSVLERRGATTVKDVELVADAYVTGHAAGAHETQVSELALRRELLAACRLLLRVVELNALDPVDGDMWSIRERAEKVIARAELAQIRST